jgi:hypothetical protein
MIREATAPKQYVSRTAATRYIDRPRNVLTHHTHFGITKLVEVSYEWPELPDTLLEDIPLKDRNSETDTVQMRATKHFPLFEQCVDLLGTRTSTYHDTHDSAMSNGAKPDNTHTGMAMPATPAAVFFLGELKRRRQKGAFSNTEKEHVVGFALQWMNDEPIRQHFIVYLTDLKWIQFIRVTNIGAITESPVMDLQTTGQKWLGGLLISNNKSLGFPVEIRVVQFNNTPSHFERFVGQGGSSIVFEERGTNRVVKLYLNGEDATTEWENLVLLWERVAVLKSRCAGEFDHIIALMVPPQDQTFLADDRTAISFPWLGSEPVYSGLSFANLVNYLQLLHACDLVHRDIRISNVVLYDTRLLLIDYGTLCPANEMLPYKGAEFNASDAVLESLGSDDAELFYTPRDDLVALVRCAREMLAADRSHFRSELCAMRVGGELKTAQLISFWQKHMRGWWSQVADHASQGQYDELIRDFTEWIEL